MGEAAAAVRWEDWLNITTMGITSVIAISATLAVVIAAVMIGFTLLTLRRARRRGALPAKVSPRQNRQARPSDTPPTSG